jgi:guanine deaminase
MFCKNLLHNGTTTAAIFGTSHFEATKILNSSMLSSGLSGLVGKTSMDRNGPDSLLVPLDQDLAELEQLFTEVFADGNRIQLAITPRFAPSCSDGHLAALGRFKQTHPNLKIQTHFAENKDEIEWVKKLFPGHKDYLHVYEDNGLLGKDTILAHAIHVSDDDCEKMARLGTSISHCPSSNMFLGSGLFSGPRLTEKGVKWGLGSDVGAGTSFSMWRTMLNCYQVHKLNGHSISATELFYRATLMAAKTLGVAQGTGNFTAGKYCDVQVVDPDRNDFLAKRLALLDDPQEWLFAMITLADDRIVKSCYTSGEQRLVN